MVKGFPTHEPVTEVGVTIYCTVPADELLGLVSTLLMVLPDPALAPVMLPVMVPTVHVNVLGVEAVSATLAEDPLQEEAVAGEVTAGLGNTVTVMI